MNPSRILVLAFASLSMAGCVDRHAQTVRKNQAQELLRKEVPVTSLRTVSGVAEQKLDLVGSVEALQETTLSVEAPGRLSRVFVQEDAYVSAGELVAVIDSGGILPNLHSAEAQIAAAQARIRTAIRNRQLAPERTRAQREAAAQEVAVARAALDELKSGPRVEEIRTEEARVRSAQAELQAAEREWKRNRELAQEGAIAESVLDDLATRRDVAREAKNSAELALAALKRGPRSEQVDQAKARLQQAGASLRAADASYRLDRGLQDEVTLAEAELRSMMAQRDVTTDSLRRTRIYAPFSGRVVGKPVVAGTAIQPGEPVVRLLADRGYVFEAALPQRALKRLPTGAKVVIEVDGIERRFESKVASMASLGNAASRTLTLRMPLPGDSALRPGMFGRAWVRLSQLTGTRVPSTSIVTHENQTFVWVREEGRIRRVAVSVIHQADRTSLVRGVEPGAEVIVQGAARLSGTETLRFEKEVGSWD